MKFLSQFHFLLFIAGLMMGFVVCGCVRLPSTVSVERNIVYAQTGVKTLKLDIYFPKQATNRLPVVVWLHPGAWDMGSKNFCPIGFMADRNIAIVSIDYRLSTTAPFPAQIHDCKGAVRWLRAHAGEYNLDPDRIGIFGASAGGHLALLLATTDDQPEMEGDVGGNLNYSSRVQCVCAFYPPTDLNQLVVDAKSRQDPGGDVAKLIGGPVATHVTQAVAASPMTYLNRDCCPVFLMHGAADKLVPVEQSRMFYDAATKLGVPAQLEIIPGKGHGIIAPPKVADEIYAFYDRYLR